MHSGQLGTTNRREAAGWSILSSLRCVSRRETNYSLRLRTITCFVRLRWLLLFFSFVRVPLTHDVPNANCTMCKHTRTMYRQEEVLFVVSSCSLKSDRDTTESRFRSICSRGKLTVLLLSMLYFAFSVFIFIYLCTVYACIIWSRILHYCSCIEDL